MAQAVLKVSNLTKRFGSLVAVQDLSLEIHQGEVFGFLGPNGAGKTTSISMMCGLLRPDGGRVELDGQELDDRNPEVRSRIGICPQRVVIWERLTCLEQLTFVGELYGLPSRKARQRGAELLDAMGLTEKSGKVARTLSGGMQRRLNLVLALVHDPQVVFLDEPEAGLDPQSRILVRDYIRVLARQKTVVLTTHNMDEAERLAERVAIIDHGKLLVVDTPDGLKHQAGVEDVLEVQASAGSAERLGPVVARLKERHPAVTEKDGLIAVGGADILAQVPDVLGQLRASDIGVVDLRIRKRTLEDVFISLTGRGLRE